jgi:hypothetical protein
LTTSSQAEERIYRWRFIWADKIALALFLLVALAIFVLWGLAFVATGMAGASHIIASVGYAGLIFSLALLIGGLWLFMRAIDFVTRLVLRYLTNRRIIAANSFGLSTNHTTPIKPMS